MRSDRKGDREGVRESERERKGGQRVRHEEKMETRETDSDSKYFD